MIASLITGLFLLGFITKQSAITSLIVAGVLLIIAELAIVSFGLLAFNGIIALYAAVTLFTGTDVIFGINVGWPVLFGIALVEIVIIVSIFVVHMWLRGQKTTTGTEAMIGSKATIITWDGKKGTVRYEGEIWKASAETEIDLNIDEEATITSVEKMSLTISA